MEPRRARLLVIVAAVLWSLSGVFARALTAPTIFGLDVPPIHPMTMAGYRALFASMSLSLTLRRGDVSFRWPMVPMALSFATMNALFVVALARGSAANAILLQYTAPLWVAALGPLLVGERFDRRGVPTLLLGTLGIGVIVQGNWHRESPLVVLCALGSGLAYAGVLLGLRALRTSASNWLTVVNHSAAALLLLPAMLNAPIPSWGQLGWLLLFGTVQMALPYWIMARALRGVTAQQASTLTLLEPLLNPVWAFLLSPKTDKPTPPLLIGGALILVAVVGQAMRGGSGSKLSTRTPDAP